MRCRCDGVGVGVTVFAGIKPGAVTAGVTGPTSQIPGLSQSADVSVPVERTSGRRVGIFETDSDYVKLAKSGGHKGERARMKNSNKVSTSWPSLLV